MTKNRRLVSIFNEDYCLIRKEVELEYRNHHPEMDGIPLSMAKLIREMRKFYLKKKW